MLKVNAGHLISNCRVSKTLKFVAAHPLEKALQLLSKTNGEQYQNLAVGMSCRSEVYGTMVVFLPRTSTCEDRRFSAKLFSTTLSEILSSSWKNVPLSYFLYSLSDVF